MWPFQNFILRVISDKPKMLTLNNFVIHVKYRWVGFMVFLQTKMFCHFFFPQNRIKRGKLVFFRILISEMWECGISGEFPKNCWLKSRQKPNKHQMHYNNDVLIANKTISRYLNIITKVIIIRDLNLALSVSTSLMIKELCVMRADDDTLLQIIRLLVNRCMQMSFNVYLLENIV